MEITKSPLKNYERKLYDLHLRILEQENLTGEENELLKKFIESNMYNIQKDSELKTRAEAILNK